MQEWINTYKISDTILELWELHWSVDENGMLGMYYYIKMFMFWSLFVFLTFEVKQFGWQKLGCHKPVADGEVWNVFWEWLKPKSEPTKTTF